MTGSLNDVLRHVRAVTEPHAASETDGQLLARFAARREEEPFAALLRRHGPMVLRVGRRVLGREQDAEDVYQATFLLLARKAGSIRNGESVASWLHGVAHRLAVKARARAATRAIHERAAVRHEAVPQAPAAYRELQAALDEALLQVPANHRAALTLCYLEGLSHEEAARQLGCAVGTVGSWVARGRQQLHAHLARRGVTLSAAALATALAADATAAPPAQLTAATLAAALAKTVPLAALKLAAAGVLALAITAAALAWSGQAGKTPRAAAEPPAHVDRLGDPLPAEAVARIGTTRLRHGDFVYTVAFSPDGKRLASFGTDGVRTWDAATGRETGRLVEAAGYRVNQAAFSPDGKYAATTRATADWTITAEPLLLWDLATGKKVKEFGKAEYWRPRFSPDSKLLAVPRFDGMVETWDVADGKRLAAWRANASTRVGSATALRFTADGKAVVTGGPDKALRYWDAATGKKLREFDGIPSTVGSVAVSPDGKLIACIEVTPSPAGVGGGERETHRIQIRDVVDGKVLRTLVGPEKRDPAGNLGTFRCLAFSPDGKTLAAAGFKVGVQVWDVDTGAVRRAFAPFPPHSALAFAADGKTLAVANYRHSIHLYDPATGTEVTPTPVGVGLLRRVSLTPGGTALAVPPGDSSIVLMDTQTGKPGRRYDAETESMLFEAVLSADGRTLVALGQDKTVCAWDTAAGTLLRRDRCDHLAPNSRLLDVSPDGAAFAATGQKAVAVIETRTGKLQQSLATGAAPATGAAFLPDRRTAVVWGGDRTARVYDLATGKVVRQVRPHVPPAEANVPGHAAVSADGRRIAFGLPGRVVVHDLATGDEVGGGAGLPAILSPLTLSPDGRVVAWGDGQNPAVHLLEVASGKERHALTGHVGPVLSAGFSADGRRLVTGGADTTGLVWDLSKRAVADKPEALWGDLGSADVARAYRAVRGLAAAAGVEAFLRGRVEAVPAADAKHLAKLIADLDSDTAANRDAAAKELEALGERAAGALRAARAAGLSAEPRRRVETLLKRLAAAAREPSGDRLRLARAVEVLELAGSRDLLAALAKGAAGAWLTEDAKAALGRLEGRRAR